MHSHKHNSWGWVKWVRGILKGDSGKQHHADISGVEARTLAGVEPGREVSVAGFVDLAGGQRKHLQAYGLLPGRRVRVLAQRPVTIVQIEQTELAFEGAVAASVLVGD